MCHFFKSPFPQTAKCPLRKLDRANYVLEAVAVSYNNAACASTGKREFCMQFAGTATRVRIAPRYGPAPSSALPSRTVWQARIGEIGGCKTAAVNIRSRDQRERRVSLENQLQRKLNLTHIGSQRRNLTGYGVDGAAAARQLGEIAGVGLTPIRVVEDVE